MADRPILFSAPMVRALLDGRKTQTRRKLPLQPPHDMAFIGLPAPKLAAVFGYTLPCDDVKIPVRCTTGDRLWVKETWQGLTFGDYRPTKHEPCELRFAATDPCANLNAEARGYTWRPSIFMPRWASRITLIVTDVRIQRLQDISEADAIAEGCRQYSSSTKLSRPFNPDWKGIYSEGYAELWNEINGLGAWESNPWVAAYTFRVIKQNIDQIKDCS